MNPLKHAASGAADRSSGNSMGEDSRVRSEGLCSANTMNQDSPIRMHRASIDMNLPPFRNEPVSDFAQPLAREAMTAALVDARSQFGRYYPLVIDGEEIKTSSEVRSLNPSKVSETVGIVATADVNQANAAVAAAKRALPSWVALGARSRAEYILQAAEAMRRRRFELASWMIYECGKPWREAEAEVGEAIDFCEYYAR